MRRRSWIGAGVALVVLGGLSCRQAAEPDVRMAQVDGAWVVGLDGTWTLVLADTVRGDRVWVVQTDSSLAQWEGQEVSVRGDLWADLDAPPAVPDVRMVMETADGQLRWGLYSGEGWLAGGGGSLAIDRAANMFRAQGAAVLMWQNARLPVRFDAFPGARFPSRSFRDTVPPGAIQVGSPGVVTLRMDDCAAADTMSFRILHRLHLVAEVGVPTRKVEQPRFCTWDLVRAMWLDGNAIEAHSRTHGGPPPTFADFYLETVGALQDLRVRGFDPEIFIQPGNWTGGKANFDRPEKLRTPYGALLRRSFLAVEAYVHPPTAVGFPLGNGYAPEQIPIKFFATPERLSQYLHAVAAESLWTHLSWHSARITAEELESRLAVVAAFRDSGLVTVLPYRLALRAVRQAPGPGSPSSR